MRALIVDDEPPARERLIQLLGKPRRTPVEVVGEAGSVEEALALCRERRPDVLFLDVELGGIDGFGLLRELNEAKEAAAVASPIPAVVFVTAHENFALTAFEVDAVDYLLKPIHPARLEATIGRLTARMMEGAKEAPREGEVKTVITLDSGAVSIPCSSITHIEADENYTRVYLRDGRMFHVRRGLQAWEAELPEPRFVRAHRSLIVNLDAVEMLQSHSRDEGELRVSGSAEPIPLARRALQRLRRLI